MIETKTFEQLERMVMEDDQGKWDREVPVRSIHMEYDGSLKVQGQEYKLSPCASSQLFSKLSIPVAYARRCPTELLATHVNHWLDEQEDNTWLVRGKEDRVRAFLSTSYSVLDNHQLLKTLRRAMGGEDFRISSGSVGDEYGFHARLVIPGTSLDLGRLKTGERDQIFGGIHISNSEIGRSSASSEMLIWRLICTNGMLGITPGTGHRQAHRGNGVMESFREKLEFSFQTAPTETRLRMEGLEKSMGELTTRGEEIVQYYARENGLSKPVIDEISKQLHAQRRSVGEEFSKYDLVNAFTAGARIVKGDHRYEVEVLAGRLLEENLEKLENDSVELRTKRG